MTERRYDKKLFEQETQVLRTALELTQRPEFEQNELQPFFKKVVGEYDKLLRITRKVFRISDSQGRILHKQQSELKNLLDNANQGFLTFGADLAVDSQYSAQCSRIFEKKVENHLIYELLDPMGTGMTESFKEIFEAIFASNDREYQYSMISKLPQVINNQHKNIQVEYKLISQAESGLERTVMMLILTDITEKRIAEEKINYLSYHDKLTAVYNRAYVDMMLPELSAGHEYLSVIITDMNGLKLTNDVFGHTEGDKLLVNMAQCLSRACRKSDIIARWGGDEFLVLLPGADEDICEQVCERIKTALAETAAVPISLSAAIGRATKTSSRIGTEELFSLAETRMYSDKMSSRKQVQTEIFAGLNRILDKECIETRHHIDSVGDLVLRFSAYAGLEADSAEYRVLEQLIPLHDIGKVAIAKEILSKPAALLPEEWEEIKKHSEIGCRMARAIGEGGIAELILTLHERWDGLGYPYGLKQEEIPYLARLFAVAEAFAVMIEDRPYRAGLDYQSALAEIEAGRGTQFDPSLAEAFIRFIRTKWAGKTAQI